MLTYFPVHGWVFDGNPRCMVGKRRETGFACPERIAMTSFSVTRMEEADIVVYEDREANRAIKDIECNSKVDPNVIIFGRVDPDCGNEADEGNEMLDNEDFVGKATNWSHR